MKIQEASKDIAKWINSILNPQTSFNEESTKKDEETGKKMH